MNFCTNCGWRFSGAYCPKCGNENETTEDEPDGDVGEVTLGGEISHEEREAKARRELWTAMHAHSFDAEKCKKCARDLKALSPEDYYANFVDVFFTGSDRAISRFLNSSGGEKSSTGIGMYADAVLDCVCVWMTRGIFYAVRDYKERSFTKDFSKYDKAIESHAPFTERLRMAIDGRISSLKRLELEERIKKNEALRLESEERKKKEETLRLESEERTKKEKALRLEAEEQRRKDEALRLESEERKKKEEALRLESEDRRKKEEALKFEAEAARKKKEEEVFLKSGWSKGLEFELRGGECFVTGLGHCEDLDLVIPAEHMGMPVTAIAKEAFKNCYDIKSVIIPSSVTSIGKSAFESCSSITSVIIPSSVTSIGEKAFWFCKFLTSITIPYSLTAIGDSAFSGCGRLVEVRNLSSLEIKAGDYGNGCVAYYAKHVYKDANRRGTFFTTEEGYEFYKYRNTYYLIGYKGSQINLSLPETVEGEKYEIYNYAFSNCKSLKTVYIPDSVTSIGEGAFYNCAALISIKIPSGVTAIRRNTFNYCSTLKSVIIPDSVTSIDDFAFCQCSSLTSIVIPSSVTKMSIFIFGCCSSLTSVTIPPAVTSIDYSAFDFCSSLTSVIIPSSVKSIEDFAFHGCKSLKRVFYSGSQSSWNKIRIEEENDNLTNAEIYYDCGEREAREIILQDDEKQKMNNGLSSVLTTLHFNVKK